MDESKLFDGDMNARAQEISLSTRKSAWGVGELAVRAWYRNISEKLNFMQGQVFAYVAHKCDCSTSQVAKMCQLASVFPESVRSMYPDYRLGYYEVAADFVRGGDIDEALGVLDYVGFCYEQAGEWPRANRLSFLYRKHILGEYVGQDIIVVDGHELIPLERQEPNPFDEPAWSWAGQIVNMVAIIRGRLDELSADKRRRVERVIGDLEELLLEFVA